MLLRRCHQRLILTANVFYHKTIIGCINTIDHSGYVEPFVGLGGVFLKHNQQSKTDVINDISGDIVTLFRVLQRHYPYFMDFLKFHITSRREFEWLVKTDSVTLTDIWNGRPVFSIFSAPHSVASRAA